MGIGIEQVVLLSFIFSLNSLVAVRLSACLRAPWEDLMIFCRVVKRMLSSLPTLIPGKRMKLRAPRTEIPFTSTQEPG